MIYNVIYCPMLLLGCTDLVLIKYYKLFLRMSNILIKFKLSFN